MVAAARVATLLVAGLIGLSCGWGGPDSPKRPTPASVRASSLPDALAHEGIDVARPGKLRLCGAGVARLVQVPGEQAFAVWHVARERRGVDRRWPVLMGSPEDVRLVRSNLKVNCRDGLSPEREIERAAKVDVERFLRGRKSYVGLKRRDLTARPPLPDLGRPTARPLTTSDVVTDRPLKRVTLALLPSTDGTEAPALLLLGNYNDNPQPAAHVAIQRRWRTRFGAEIVAVTGDVIETRSTRPPDAPAEAIDLARQQFIYAPDIVQQGVGDFAALAATLEDAPLSYFWWD